MDIFDLFGKITLYSNVEEQLNKDEGLMSRFTGSMGSALSTAAKVGAAAVAAMSTAVIGFAKSAIDAGQKFDASMSGVAAISGATEDDLESLRQKALEMGESTKFSASEAADAMRYMAMAGWKTEDMLNGISGIMSLAAASGEDLATTSDIVTDALTAFGLTAGDSSDFANVLAAAASNANTNVSMMGETFKYVAPLAGSLNINYKDMAETIGLVANAGIKGSQAGTSLRAIITRLSTDAGASGEKLGALGIMTEELGVAFYDSEGKVRDFSDILDETRAAWDKLDPKKATEFAKQIAGQEGLSTWLALMNAAPGDIEKVRSAISSASEEVDGFDGAAAKMADTMEQNLQGALTSFGSAMEGLQISISDKITPILSSFVGLGTEAVRGMAAAFRTNGLEGLVGAIQEPLSKAIGKVTELLPTVLGVGIDLVGALGKGIMDNSDQIIDGAITIVSKIVEGLIDAAPELYDGAANIVMNLGERLFTIASDFITNTLPSLIPAALEMLMQFSGTLRENVGVLIDSGLELIMALAQSLIDNIPVFIETVPTIISNLAGIINDNAPKLIESGITLIGKLVVGIINAVPTLIAEFPKILKAVADVITAFNWVGLGQHIINFITNGLQSLFTAIPGTLKNIGQQALEWFKLINWKTLGADIIDLIKIGVQSLFGTIPNKLLEIGARAISAMANINWLSVGINIISGISSGIMQAAGGLVNAAVNAIKSAWDAMTGWLEIKSPSRKAKRIIGKNLALGIGEGFEDNMPVDEMTDSVQNAFEKIAELTPEIPVVYDTSGNGDSVPIRSGGANITINVYPSEGMDERELADMVSERFREEYNERRAVYA